MLDVYVQDGLLTIWNLNRWFFWGYCVLVVISIAICLRPTEHMEKKHD